MYNLLHRLMMYVDIVTPLQVILSRGNEPKSLTKCIELEQVLMEYSMLSQSHSFGERLRIEV